jgi:sterol 3beta-glucosyltransferase
LAIQNAGIGPSPIIEKNLSVDEIFNAVRYCLQSDVIETAEQARAIIVKEDGASKAVDSFHQPLKMGRVSVQYH